MTLAIGIKVDSRQVREARKEIEVFNKTLTDTKDRSTIDLGVGSSGDLQETAALLTKIREEVSRMGELSRTATNRGGMLRKEQFVEAGDLAKRVQADFGKWTSEIDKAREALKRLQAEKNQIGRDFMMGRVAPGDMQAKMEREASIEGEIQGARDRVAYMERNQDKLRPLGDRARQYTNVLSNTGVDPEAQGASLKKAMGFALAAAGGFSIMSFLSQSRGMYQQFAGHENQLYARGLRDVMGGGGAAAALGIDPMEHYGLQEQLTRSMGLSGKRLSRMERNTELFSRYYGMNLSEVGGFGASVYQASGARGMGATALISLQQQGIEKTRMPETMRLMEGHLRTMADARKGAGLTEGNVATALALATAAMREGRPEMSAYLKSGNLSNTLQNGLQGAGSTPGEIAIFNAIGGFKGPMTYKKIHEMNLLRQGGFMEHPELLDKVLQNMPKGLDRAGQAGWLESVFPQWASGKSAEMFLDLYQSGSLTNLKRGKLGGDESAAQAAMLKEIQDNPAFSKMVRMALKSQLKTQTGQGIDDIIEPLETRVLQGAGKVLDSDLVKNVKLILGEEGDPNNYDQGFDGYRNKMHRVQRLDAESKKLPYYREMLAASKKTGVPVELLLAIAKQESGFRSNVISPKGAVGVMQLMPGTAKAYGVKDITDPGENILGAAKYLSHLGQRYNGDMTSVLAAYNMGETKYDRYGVAGGGAETRNYIKNVGGDLMARSGLSELPKAQSAGDRIANDLAGMFSTVTVGGFEKVMTPIKLVLDRIAAALERPTQAQPLPIKQ